MNAYEKIESTEIINEIITEDNCELLALYFDLENEDREFLNKNRDGTELLDNFKSVRMLLAGIVVDRNPLSFNELQIDWILENTKPNGVSFKLVDSSELLLIVASWRGLDLKFYNPKMFYALIRPFSPADPKDVLLYWVMHNNDYFKEAWSNGTLEFWTELLFRIGKGSSLFVDIKNKCIPFAIRDDIKDYFYKALKKENISDYEKLAYESILHIWNK